MASPGRAKAESGSSPVVLPAPDGAEKTCPFIRPIRAIPVAKVRETKGGPDISLANYPQIERIERMLMQHQERLETLVTRSESRITASILHASSGASKISSLVTKEFDPDCVHSSLDAAASQDVHLMLTSAGGLADRRLSVASNGSAGAIDNHTNGPVESEAPTRERRGSLGSDESTGSRARRRKERWRVSRRTGETNVSSKSWFSVRAHSSVIKPSVSGLLGDLQHVKSRLTRRGSKASDIYDLDNLFEDESMVDRFVQSTPFSNLIACLIVLDAVMIVIQTEWQAHNIGERHPKLFDTLDLFFTFVFLAELFLRLASGRMSFFIGEDSRWNLFDGGVIVVGALDILLRTVEASWWTEQVAVRALRVLRLVRTVRTLRILKFFRELRLVVYGMMNSLSSLFWLIVLLAFIILIVAVVIMEVVIRYLGEHERLETMDADLVSQLREYYASMPITLFSLYKAISGGESWGVLAQPLFQISISLGLLFSAYIALVVFAVLNVVTGVFVDNAQRAAQNDADHAMLEETAERQQHIGNITSFFTKADADASGELTKDEFLRHVKDPAVQSYFRTLGLDFELVGVDYLFNLLDFDGGGKMDVNELVVGCTKLRGNAKSLDLALLQHEVKRQKKMLVALDDRILSGERRILAAIAGKSVSRPEKASCREVPEKMSVHH